MSTFMYEQPTTTTLVQPHTESFATLFTAYSRHLNAGVGFVE